MNSACAIVVSSAVRKANSARVWRTHLLVLAVLAGLLGWFSAQAIANAVQVWWVSASYSHCFLIIPVSAYFCLAQAPTVGGSRPLRLSARALVAAPLVLMSVAGVLPVSTKLSR